MAKTYIRLEETLRQQDAYSIGRTVVALELLALVAVLAFADLEEHWDIPVKLAIGLPATLLGMFLYRRSQLWGRILIGGGGLALLVFIAWLSPLLAVLVGIIYFIVLCLSLVA